MNSKLIRALLIMVLFEGITFKPETSATASTSYPERKCTGYSIIEFGKAVDCKGDTIRLTRKNGLQVFIAAHVDISKETSK